MELVETAVRKNVDELKRKNEQTAKGWNITHFLTASPSNQTKELEKGNYLLLQFDPYEEEKW